MPAEFPLSANGQAGNVAGKVQLKTIERIRFGQVSQKLDFVIPNLLNLQVPQSVRPPGFHCPVGMRCLQRMRRLGPSFATGRLQVDFADAMIPKDFEITFFGLPDEPLNNVSLLVGPMIDQRTGRGGVTVLQERLDIPPDRIDLHPGFVNPAETIVEPVIPVFSQCIISIVLHGNSPTSIHGLTMSFAELNDRFRLGLKSVGETSRSDPGDGTREEGTAVPFVRLLFHVAAEFFRTWPPMPVLRSDQIGWVSHRYPPVAANVSSLKLPIDSVVRPRRASWGAVCYLVLPSWFHGLAGFD